MPGETVNLPGGIHLKKNVAIGIGVAAASVAGYYLYRNHQANAAASSTAASGTGIDPQTGYAYGSPEDQAALAQQANATLPTYDSASSVGGQVIGYDQYGQPIYGTGGGGTGGGIVGPGSYTNNAQWSQAVEATMGSSGADTIAAALGKYLLGQPLTADQVTVIQEAIANQGYPPVPGPNGNPPNYQTQESPPPTGGGKVSVPNVVGFHQADARRDLESQGFKVTIVQHMTGGHPYVVTSQTPKGGSQATKGSRIRLNVRRQG